MNRTFPYASTTVVIAGMAAALHIAKLPPAIAMLQIELGMDLVQAGFLLSMVQLAGMTLGLVVGLNVDRVGLRRSMLSGLLLLSIASALGGAADSVPQLLVLRALEGLGFLCVVMPAPSLIRRTVPPEQLSARLGMWGAYMPTGSAAALLVGPWIMTMFNWQGWWWLASLCTLLAAWAIRRWVPKLPPMQVAHDADHGWAKRLRLTLSSPGPWWVALSFAVYSSQWLAVIGFLPTVYSQIGLSNTSAGALTALVALVNVLGNLGAGRLLQKSWPATRLLWMGFACMALGATAAFAQWQELNLPLPLRYAAVLLFSACGGLIPSTLFSTAVKLAPSESTVSTTVGYMQQWSALGQFAGPPLVAWVASWAGGWQWTWCVTLSLCLVGAWLARRIELALAHLANKSELAPSQKCASTPEN